MDSPLSSIASIFVTVYTDVVRIASQITGAVLKFRINRIWEQVERRKN